jgi:transcriptional regulator with XRE-family HTH domain
LKGHNYIIILKQKKFSEKVYKNITLIYPNFEDKLSNTNTPYLLSSCDKTPIEDIKLIRISKGVTQVEMANSIGISSRQYIKYENGEVSPKQLIIDKLYEYVSEYNSQENKTTTPLLNSNSTNTFQTTNTTNELITLKILLEQKEKIIDQLNKIIEYQNRQIEAFTMSKKDVVLQRQDLELSLELKGK